MWMTIGAVIGAGVFVLTGQEAHTTAGPSIILSYAAAGFAAMLAVLNYTEFAVEIPVAEYDSGTFHSFSGGMTAGNVKALGLPLRPTGPVNMAGRGRRKTDCPREKLEGRGDSQASSRWKRGSGDGQEDVYRTQK